MTILPRLDTIQKAADCLKRGAASLPQTRTNGLAKLGTLLAPVLPFFLTNNPLPQGFPWAGRNEDSTDPFHQYPTTGVIRTYDFTVSRGIIAPDGYERDVLLVNGAFPGPTIEANWGDNIQVKVHNNITGPEDGTAIHWHGFLQQGTPWQDGSPSLTQCPIAPGKSYTYQFKATLFGTSWYHSHYSAQYSGGVLGPIVVYGPSQESYDVDVGPIMLADWHHKSYDTVIDEMLAPGGSPQVYSDNTLINGKNNLNCSSLPSTSTNTCTNDAGLSQFRFKTGKTHRLRLINSGSEGVIRFSIDNHTMRVIANDFTPLESYTTEVVTLGVGQRVDVLVTANAGPSTSAFWIRANHTSCSLARRPNALAMLFYDGADTSVAPTSLPSTSAPADPGTCTNDDTSITKPRYATPVSDPSTTYTMNISLFRNASNVALWNFDGVSFRGNYNSPPLLLANAGNTSFPAEWNVKDFGTNSTVRIIVNNKTPGAHPMHLHGFDFSILHEGSGSWDGTIIRSDNPMRRDVALVRGNGHIVIQFNASDNPGLWGFHCHFAWHASGGFFSSFLVDSDRIRQMKIPQTVVQTCRDWAAWTETNVPDQIDSGV